MTVHGRRAVLVAGLGAATLLGSAGALSLRRYLHHPRQEKQVPLYDGPEASLAEVLAAPPFDVCIIGSGFAGTALGTRLARAGMRTVILEAGAVPSKGHSEKFALINQATMSGDQPYAVPATRLMMPGGTSALWTGNSPRLLPIDFERNAYTPAGAQWPVTYAQIDPHYEKAEDTLNVSGESNAPYLAPRTHPLHDERRAGNRTLKSVLSEAGIHSFDSFRSRSETGGDGGPIRVARDMLPQYAQIPGAALVTGISARRLVGSSPDRIEGLLVRDIDGNSSMIRARVFVVAAGGVESARLLLLSRSEQFPNGPGNGSDQVGRTFADHKYLNFTSRIPAPRVLFGGAIPQVVRSVDYYETFKRRGLGSLGYTVGLRRTHGPELELHFTAECELEPAHANCVSLDESLRDPWGDPVAHLHFSVSERDQKTLDAARATTVALMRKLGGHDIQELTSHWGHHHLGIVRMGNDPRTSVVDQDLKLHGVRNAYALTSGNFVTSGPANPTLLIVAFAHRLADHIVEHMHAGAFETRAV